MKRKSYNSRRQTARDGYWKDGDQLRVARVLGVSRQYVNDVLHRRKRVSPTRAMRLESITGVPWQAWLMNTTSKHRAFYGQPQKI